VRIIFEASGFVKDRLNIGCVPKPYEHSANEDFVLLEELLFSEDVESVVMQDETFVECSCHQGRSKGGGGAGGPGPPQNKSKNKLKTRYICNIYLSSVCGLKSAPPQQKIIVRPCMSSGYNIDCGLQMFRSKNLRHILKIVK
jgi:hypothetical protein